MNSSRRQALSIVTGLPLALAACAATQSPAPGPARQAPAPSVSSGQRWRYQRINRFNDEPVGELLAEVIQVQPELIVRLSDDQGRIWGEEIYTNAWTIRQEPFYNETLRFQDPVRLLPADLSVGATDETTTHYRPPDGRSGNRGLRWRSTLKATGWELITVPAGSFDCLRIEKTVSFEPYQMGRLRAYRNDTLWYSPRVRRWVQREWAGYYLDETSLADESGAIAAYEREDMVRWVLTETQSAPIAG